MLPNVLASHTLVLSILENVIVETSSMLEVSRLMLLFALTPTINAMAHLESSVAAMVYWMLISVVLLPALAARQLALPQAQHRPAQLHPAQYHPAQYLPAQYLPAQYHPAQHHPAQL